LAINVAGFVEDLQMLDMELLANVSRHWCIIPGALRCRRRSV
jgi:hypothetical protein